MWFDSAASAPLSDQRRFGLISQSGPFWIFSPRHSFSFAFLTVLTYFLVEAPLTVCCRAHRSSTCGCVLGPLASFKRNPRCSRCHSVGIIVWPLPGLIFPLNCSDVASPTQWPRPCGAGQELCLSHTHTTIFASWKYSSSFSGHH